MKGVAASFLGMLVMACSGCGGGGGGSAPAASSSSAQYPIIIEQYGDSTTVGCTVSPGAKASDACPTDGYAVASVTESLALQEALLSTVGTGITVVNKGVASIAADDLLTGSGRENGQTWEQSMSTSKAQIVTVNLGLNDANRPNEDFVNDIRNIVTIARAHGKAIVLYTPNPSVKNHKSLVATFRNQIIGVGAEFKVPVIDTYSAMSLDKWAELIPDGLHPTSAGYQAKADFAAPFLAAIVRDPDHLGSLATPGPSIQVTAIEKDPVMGRGAPGTWEGEDVLNPSVIQRNGQLIDYYSGYDGKIWRTGYASSHDSGKTWAKHPAPVIDLDAWNKTYIAANGSAVEVNGQVYNYFAGVDKNGVGRIGLATSQDGLNFTVRPEAVYGPGEKGAWDSRFVGDPYVYYDGKQYLLYFLTADEDYKFALGVATSPDGIAWTKHDASIMSVGATGEFDSFAVGEPAVVKHGQIYYMLYTSTNALHQRSIGWASSTDGINWTKQGLLVTDAMRQEWDSQVICDPTILPTGNNDGTYYVWFGGGDQRQDSQNLNGQIGRMTIKLN